MFRPLIPLALALTGCVKTPAAFHLQDPNQWPEKKDGVVYSLPLTVFVVQATGTLVSREAPACPTPEGAGGDARRAAIAKALGYASWKVALEKNPAGRTFALKDAKLSTRTEADPDAVFVSAYKATGLADSSLKITLGPEGTFQSSEASATDKVLPTMAKVVEVGATIVATVFPLRAGAADPTPTVPNPELEVCKSFDDDLDKVKAQRKLLYSLEVPMPKDTLELLLTELKVAEEEVKGRYLGTAEVTQGVVTCEVTPKKGVAEDTFLSYTRAGILKDQTRCVFPKAFEHAAQGAVVPVKLTVTPVATTLATAHAKKPDVKDPGFYYRVPVAANVSVTGGKLEVLATRHLVPQLGEFEALPRAKGGSPKMAVELYADTGAIKSVLYDRKAPDAAAAAGSAGAATTTLLGAEKARRDAADPLVGLQYEQALLEAEIAIHAANEAIASWP